LTRLRVSEVDLLLLHWPNPRVPLSETLDALAHVRKLGMARHVGVSNFTVALIDGAVAKCAAPLVCNQVEYHPYLDQTRVREACARHGMAVVAYSPIAKGRASRQNSKPKWNRNRPYARASPRRRSHICRFWRW